VGQFIDIKKLKTVARKHRTHDKKEGQLDASIRTAIHVFKQKARMFAPTAYFENWPVSDPADR